MNKQSGYTVVEALFYVFLAVTVIYTLFFLLGDIMRIFANFRVERSLTYSANLAMDRLLREIRQADSVDLTGSAFNTHPGRLKLNRPAQGGNPSTVEFYLDKETLMIKEDNGIAASTTASSVKTSNLVFRQINTPHSQAVKVEMTLETQGNTPRQHKFYGTAVLRGSY